LSFHISLYYKRNFRAILFLKIKKTPRARDTEAISSQYQPLFDLATVKNTLCLNKPTVPTNLATAATVNFHRGKPISQ